MLFVVVPCTAFFLLRPSTPQTPVPRILMMSVGSVRADPLRKGDRVVVIGSSGGCGQLIRCVYVCVTSGLLVNGPLLEPFMSQSPIATHGQTTSARLAKDCKYKTRAVARSEGKLRQVLGLSDAEIEYAQADSRDYDSLLAPLSDADAVVIATGTSAFPSPRWKGGNTPDAVDRKGVRNILAALTAKPRKKPVKKVVFLSSVGVLRTKQLPFNILNL